MFNCQSAFIKGEILEKCSPMNIYSNRKKKFKSKGRLRETEPLPRIDLTNNNSLETCQTEQVAKCASGCMCVCVCVCVCERERDLHNRPSCRKATLMLFNKFLHAWLLSTDNGWLSQLWMAWRKWHRAVYAFWICSTFCQRRAQAGLEGKCPAYQP